MARVLMWCFLVFVFAAIGANITSSAAISQDVYSQSREWRSAEGSKSVKGKVKQFNDAFVQLLRDDNGQELTVKIEDLADYDKRLLMIPKWHSEDKSQYDAQLPYLSTMAEGTDSANAMLLKLHRDTVVAPYAGIWAAVGASAAKNEFDKAIGILKQSIERIDAQRKIDSSRHSQTLASSLNNLAICQIKAHNPSNAGAAFLRILESGLPLNDEVIHNVAQFVKLTEVTDSPLSLSPSVRKKLSESMPEGIAENKTMAVGWYYTLDVDLPDSKINHYWFDGCVRPGSDFEICWAATAVAVTDRMVLAPLPMIDGKQAPASGIVFTGLAPTAQRSGISQAAFRVVTQRDSAMLLELAPDIQLDGFRKLPSSMRQMKLQPAGFEFEFGEAEMFALFRYKPQLTALTSSLQSIPGRPEPASAGATSAGPLRNWQWKSNAGLPGGVVCSSEGHAVGLAVFPISPDSPVDSGAVLMEQDLKGVLNQASGMAGGNGQASMSRNEKVLAAQAACLVLLGWQKQPEVSVKTLGQVIPNRRELSVRDQWCVQCQGSGFFDCVNPACHKGVETYKQRVQVGVNKNNGAKVFADKNFTRPCNLCNRTGVRPCKFCKQGRLN